MSTLMGVNKGPHRNDFFSVTKARHRFFPPLIQWFSTGRAALELVGSKSTVHGAESYWF